MFAIPELICNIIELNDLTRCTALEIPLQDKYLSKSLVFTLYNFWIHTPVPDKNITAQATSGKLGQIPLTDLHQHFPNSLRASAKYKVVESRLLRYAREKLT